MKCHNFDFKNPYGFLKTNDKVKADLNSVQHIFSILGSQSYNSLWVLPLLLGWSESKIFEVLNNSGLRDTFFIWSTQTQQKILGAKC